MNIASPPENSTANRQIARSAGTVMIAMVLGQLVGLVAKSLIGSTFGTSTASEAFFAANRYSELLFTLMAGGALGSAFIPTFTGLITKSETRSAWQLASAICNLLVAVLTAASLLSALAAPWIVRYLLAPGFTLTDPAKEQLTIQLLRIQLPSVVIFGLSGLVMGVLNAHRRFLLPALAPAMYAVGQIAGLLVLVPGMGVYGLAWGVVIGALLHLLVQVPALIKLPSREYFASFGTKLESVRTVLLLMLPRLFGVAIVQLNFLLNTILASFQPEGSLAGITLAFPLMIMPQVAIAQAIAIVALPTFSAQAALGKTDEIRSSLAATLRGALLLAIPAMVGLVLLRQPIVELIYQRGEFSDHSASLVAWALLWYAMGLPGHAVVEIVSRAFYALQDTRTPVYVGAAAMTLNLALSLALSWLFGQTGWMPHGGLALANTLATTLEAWVLLVYMRRRLKGIRGGRILNAALKSALAAAVMGITIWYWMDWVAGRPLLLQLAGAIGFGAVLYGLLLYLYRLEETDALAAFVKNKIHR